MAQFTWYRQNSKDDDSNKTNNDYTTASQHQQVPLCLTSDVQLRFLCPDDLEEVRTLCQDWFPIDYPFSWYEDITSSTRFFALAAVYNLTIIGLIVAEIKPYARLNKEDRDILPESMGKECDVAYILSLGVHKKYRRNGIGSLLLDALINYLTTSEKTKVKSIFLHVLTTNQPAILFYEKRRFRMHTFLPYYYSIKGYCKDGFSYVLYINGGHPPWTLLEFAVSSKGRINFYTSDWKLSTTAAHQFDEMTALAFDEADETLYFNDQIHHNETIFSLRLASNENHFVERIVKKTKADDKVQGITFDPLERTLYWTDAASGIIYQMNLNGNQEPSVLIKLNNSKKPHGIAIDICRRKLYWTNANVMSSSIERISLDGTNYEILIEKDLHMPRGIVVDQFTRRIFWVDDLPGDHFSVESANLDGTDRRDLVRKLYHVPFDVAVDATNVYWTDEQDNAIWKISKNASEDDAPTKLQNFDERNAPKGIIIRNHFLSAQANNPECRSVINIIKSTIATSTPNIPTQRSDEPRESTSVQCLNNGEFDEKTKLCKCHRDFTGTHCEIPKCYNYCVEGTCEITSYGNAVCKCRPGFTGDRCEYDICNNYCLNGGHCVIENDERNCQCPKSYFGHRCENMNIQEMCTRFCNKEDIDARNVDLEVVCNNCSKNGSLALNSYYGNGGERQSVCKESILNSTAIFVSCGVVVSLALVYIIIKTVRHVYKPLRPRIKKTYVVHKNVVPTPLTCRPSTEQCEITIENCCNMNICDTPCFDPKTLQADAKKKEDKKMLLNNSDDLLY